MAAFGVGPELAAQCPKMLPPDGWRSWSEADGPIPEELAKRALDLSGDQSVPLGSTESYPLPGVTTLIRVEPHNWGRDASGNFVQGCFRAGAVFLPGEGGAGTPTSSKLDRVVGVLTAVSLGIGIVTAVATRGKR